MRDTVTNLTNLLTGQVGKNILASQKKIKNRLAKALLAGESSTEASGTEGQGKSKHRGSALHAHASKQAGSSALSSTPGMDAQVVATDTVPDASSFQAVLVKVSGQAQAKESKESSDVESVTAVAPTDSSPSGKSLTVAQVQTAPAAKPETKSRSQSLAADSEQVRSDQAAQDSALRQTSQHTIQQDSADVLHAEPSQQAGSQSQQPAAPVDAATVQAKPSATDASVPSAKVSTEVSESRQVSEVSGQQVQEAQRANAQVATDNSSPLPADVPSASTAQTETKTQSETIAAGLTQVRIEQTEKAPAPQRTSGQASGQISRQQSSRQVSQQSSQQTFRQTSQQTIGQQSQPVSQQAVQADSSQQAAVQLKPPIQTVDVAQAQAKPAAAQTPVTSAKALTDVSEVQQVSEDSDRPVQQAKPQVGTDNSASPSGGATTVSAATVVSEAPSVKSSVVGSGGGNKQAGLSAPPSSTVVSTGTFQAAAAQALANSNVAQAVAAGASPAASTAGDPTSSSLSGQIAHAVASVGPAGLGHQMVIQLTPPELGRVRLTLESKDDQIRGVLRVDDPGTLSQLRQEVPTLLHRLSESGLDVRQMDVVSSHQGSTQSQTFSQQQDGQAARQQQSSPWRSASPAAVSQTTFSQAAPSEDTQYVGGGSINTLV